MKMVYIASPLRGDYSSNIKNAVQYCRLAGEKGVLPLAPHIIFSQWCNDTIAEQREQGLRLGLALLQKSDELWVMGTTYSKGMLNEMKFAQSHDIPVILVTHPHDLNYYPVSADNNRLLSKFDCILESSRESYKNQLAVLKHEHLKPEYRTPRNQVWLVTHGPGVRPNYVHSDTLHLRHPVDGDCMAVGRSDVWGIPKPNTMDCIKQAYPDFDAIMQTAAEPEGELDR